MSRAVCSVCKTLVDETGAGHGTAPSIAPGSTRLSVGAWLVIPGRLVPKREGEGDQALRAQIVGGVQWRHPLGGVWTEWTLALDREVVGATATKVAWLAEYQGKLAVLFARSAAAMQRFGSSNAANPGQRYQTTWGLLECVDRGLAMMIGVTGQVADAIAADEDREFIDFSGPPDRVASLTFEGEVDVHGRRRKSFHYGHEVTAEALSLSVVAGSSRSSFSCPRCATGLSQRLTAGVLLVCPSCHTGFEVQGDELTQRFSQRASPMTIELPIGTRATLMGAFFTHAKIPGAGADGMPPWPSRVDAVVSGFIARKVVVDGQTYHYGEYTLDAGRQGFFWLVITDGEWYLARPLNSSLVVEARGGVTVGGVHFGLKEANLATVVQVEGEHDYVIKPGDEAQVADYMFGPRLISKEETDAELIWTECVRVPTAAVAQAFGVTLKASRSPLQGGAGDEDEDDEGGGGDEITSNPIFWLGVLALLFLLIVFAMNGDCGGGGGSFGFGK